MKKTFRLIIAATAAITALASCAKDIATEEILNPQEAEGQRVITIAYDAETKTSQDYDWHKVHFVEGDQIKVMDNSGTETCTIHINDGVASFSTSLTGDLTAVYPKECGYKSGRAQTITVATYPPHFQDGTLASGHIVSAQIPAGSTKAVFHNETALLRIIPPAGTKQLTVTSSSEYISDGEIVDGGYSNEAKKSVVVGDGTKELGTCYVSIHPGAKIGGLSFDAGVGSKTISSTVETKAGVAYTISDESWNIPVTYIWLSSSEASMEVGQSYKITYNIEPSNATNKTVSWESSNTSVAKVYSGSGHGTVEAIAPGTAIITATTANGLKASCEVQVVDNVILPGEFTIGVNKKIRFSRGNLQATYDGSKYSFGFAKHQYDLVGDAPGNTTIDSQKKNAVVDLFCVSHSNNNYGITTSIEKYSYAGEFVDWGKAIDNKGTWRTLSAKEWKFLLSQDDCYNSTRMGLWRVGVTVAGMPSCLILYPDGYTGNYVFNGDSTSYDTAEEWAAAEAAGVVCLPAGGNRFVNEVEQEGSRGWYWSSTGTGDYVGWHALFFCLSNSFTFDQITNYYIGKSVRLVTDVK